MNNMKYRISNIHKHKSNKIWNNKRGGDVMLTIGITTLFFLLFLFLGNVLQFLNVQAYWMIPIFLILIKGISLFYKEANTKSLEVKDFIFALIITFVFYFCYHLLDFPISNVFFTYYYLVSFICVELYADSIRFKSLI